MIKVICIGKLKEKYWVDAINEYQKRLEKYTNIQVIELMDEGLVEEVVALKKEKEKIEKYLQPKDYVVTLEIEGKQLNSIEFAEKIDQIYITHSNICFIIGGSYGLDESLKTRADFRLSFSKMTFPHQLFRVMLLEQLYRCYKINHNEKYHK